MAAILTISVILVLTAENSRNGRFRLAAITLAKVVLPHPGGPQKIRDGKNPVSLLVLRSFVINPLVPTKCFCPTNFFSDFGLSSSASGMLFINTFYAENKAKYRGNDKIGHG